MAAPAAAVTLDCDGAEPPELPPEPPEEPGPLMEPLVNLLVKLAAIAARADCG